MIVIQILSCLSTDLSISRIRIFLESGATILIDDATANDTIWSVKERVFAANPDLFADEQRIVYRPDPHEMGSLHDDHTLDQLCSAHNDSAQFTVSLADLTENEKVWLTLICEARPHSPNYFSYCPHGRVCVSFRFVYHLYFDSRAIPSPETSSA